MREVVEAEEGEVFDIELEQSLLEANRRLAEQNRALLDRYGVKAIDVMGSVGSGKTSLIARMVELLRDRYRIAYIAGDLTTTIDADAIARYGVPVVQINTGKECHLDANLVAKALKRLDLASTDLIFIENVGNLICPAEFPLGSHQRLVVVSITEGPYVVVKHPYIFMEADLAVINKIDLAEAMEVDVDKLEADIRTVNPSLRTVRTCCRTGEGVEEVIKALGL
ncbi:hydrogenase accessory protein HypB [Candidatus Bathyarchaeota archaeon]|nr:MAG: hydrogenase accessory protein HypB [Candidatus Bathyarchaeota archaeon]